ncbi:putative quinol monooxygenase [Marinobacter sp. NFXS9]|uniref:putative quinol monooxygenase n=1 Tax=Marinobacter sp. NFXS9 TaxID=2818433 RepID=UPI0032DF0B12
MIHVIATIEVQPGQLDAVMSELLKVQPMVLNEPGCCKYQPLVDAKVDLPLPVRHREDTITVIEQWASLAHLEAHMAAPHMKAYKEAVGDKVKDVSLQLLEKNTPGHRQG